MRLNRVILLIFCVILVVSSPGLAGLSGKIIGRVYDHDASKPMPNVEITLLNTLYSTRTDSLGHYFIINIPPGSYTVQAYYLGYVPAITENVVIHIDETTIVNFKLSSTIIELGRTDTYRLEAPIIKRDETHTIHTLTPFDFKLLPIETIQDLVKILPGVSIDASGNYHSRSGRSKEILFLTDGFLNMNPLEPSNNYDILSEEIHEMLVKTGTFNAEYGHALSGVVNILTHKIPSNYSGFITFQTGDIVSMHSEQFSEEIETIDPLNNLKIQGAFGGPIPKFLKDRLYFYISGRYWDDEGYLYGKKVYEPDGELIRDMENAEFIVLNPLKKLNITNKISYQIRPNMRLLYSAFYKTQKGRTYQSEEDHRWKFIPDSKLWYYSRGSSHNLTISHQTSRRLYYTFSGSYWWNKDWSHTFDSPDSPDYVYSKSTQRDSLNEFYIKGTQNRRAVQNVSTLAAKFDLNWQANLSHELKAGFEFKRHDIYSHTYFVAAPDPNSDQIGNRANPDSMDDQYRQHPMEFSIYLQDKIEWSQLILNVGLRMDGFVPDAEAATDWVRPDTSNVAAANTKFQISPRFSMAYPFSNHGKVFFSYGHFVQNPPFWALYTNQQYRRYNTRYLSLFGNGDLLPQKTISYELGLDIELADNLVGGIKTFHRDFRDLLGYGIYLSKNEYTHAVIKNADFGYAWGAILSLQKRIREFMTIHLDYTYQNAKINDSEPMPDQKFQYAIDYEKLPPSKLTQNLFYTEYLQPHSLKIICQFSNPESWGVGLYGRIESGYPYTPRVLYDSARVQVYNSERGPTQITFDLNLYKTFGIWIGRKRTNITLFLKCYNLFDNLNEEIVWRSSGRAENPIALFDNKMSDEWKKQPYWYSKPRELLFGLKYEF